MKVTSGVGALSAQKTQEAQMLRSFPRWRLACKASCVAPPQCLP